MNIRQRNAWIRRGAAVCFAIVLSTGALGGCGRLGSYAAESGLWEAELSESGSADAVTAGQDSTADSSGKSATSGASAASGSDESSAASDGQGSSGTEGSSADGQSASETGGSSSDGQSASESGGSSADSSGEEGTVCVYVCGQVKEAGVYTLPAGSRICQAIECAGGLTKKADSTAVNQAALLTDGEQIYIPTVGEQVTAVSEGGSSGKSGEAADARVNLNTAGKEELMTLNGIGESRAESILEYREEHGGFSSVEELKEVSGIGEGIYGRLEDDICI